MTSQLVKWYKENKSDKFELIMVTGDRSDKAMMNYMKKKKVNFPALKFSQLTLTKNMRSRQAYPWIVMVDENGKKVVNGVAFKELANVNQKLR